MGYSPVLAFTVDDLQEVLQRALAQGARMDGAIQYAPSGKVAALRAPSGEMLTLVEEGEHL